MKPVSVKQHQKYFSSAAKGAVAIARQYFYSVAGAPLLNLINSESEIAANSKLLS